jgi:hypothetical protein
MSASVSRTVCQFANLATFSLFATAMMIAVVNGASLRGAGPYCGPSKCAIMMAKASAGSTDRIRAANLAISLLPGEPQIASRA